ncbi:MAG: hypothetical protein Q8O34_07720 [Rhodocyclaceae bacterium]|nr:hypothetical protein [Rhodocyclaceae bacterium]
MEGRIGDYAGWRPNKANPAGQGNCGIDHAQNIPGASLLVIEGMGHDFPDALMPRLAQAIADHCDRSAGATNAAV